MPTAVSHRLLALVAALVLFAAACSGTDSATTTIADGAATIGTQPDPTTPGPGESDGPEERSAGDTESFAGVDPAPDFPSGLDWINTETELSIEGLRGKVILLDFWTYGCINCIHVIPDLKRLEEEFAEELVVIGVHSAKFANEGATENIRQIVLRYDVAHPVVNDRDFEIWRTWGVNAWPTSVLIDPAGNIVGGHSGEGVYDIVSPVIRSLVAEFDASGLIDRTPLDLALEQAGQPNRILLFPGKVEVADGDDRLFIADTGHHRIVMSDRDGTVLGVFGNGTPGFTDGPATVAQFDSPQGMTLADDGVTLYVADTNNHAVRSIDTTTGEVSTLVGTGSIAWPPTPGFAPDVGLNSPWDVLIDNDLIYVAMAGHHQLWVIDLENGITQPLVGSAREGVVNGPLAEAELAQPSGLALSDDGLLYFADSESSSIRVADLGFGSTELVAGGPNNLFEFGDDDGFGAEARFQHPLGVVIRDSDQSLVVADTYNSRLRRIDPATGETTTLLGTTQGWRDGTDPQFYEPGGLAIDGETLYVADTNNHAVRIVDLTAGSVRTLVLKGIADFEPPPDAATYRGVVVTSDPVTVPPGPVTIRLNVVLPDGYKVNDEAPSSIVITGIGDQPEVVDLTGSVLPMTHKVTFAESGDVMADLNLVYCRTDQEALCLFEQVRFVTPITVDAAGDSVIELAHEVTLPDL